MKHNKIINVSLNILNSLINNINDNDIPIIYYHNIVEGEGYSYQDINIDIFKQHMIYLKSNNYKTLLFRDLGGDFFKQTDERIVLITFDDGYFSNYNLIYELMKSYGLKYNIFLISNKIGLDDNYLNWDIINKMRIEQYVDFGDHTFSHIDARKININNYEKEIINSNNHIFRNTGIRVKDFCLPFGFYNKRTLDFLSEINIYKRIYTSDYCPTKYIDNAIVKGRIGIKNCDNLTIFRDKLMGKYNILYHLKYKWKVK